MTAEKSLAVVLKLVEFSESSLVVTLFSRDFGKIAALAKGARRQKSPFEAALDHLAICLIVFLRKSSDSLDLLTEAKLERRFRNRRRDLARLYTGYYACELVDSLTARGDPNPELFDTLVRLLGYLESEGALMGVSSHFELRLLRLTGHLPQFDTCVECGDLPNGEHSVVFSPLAGGSLCERCREGKRQVIRVPRAALEWMREVSECVEWKDSLGERLKPFQGTVRGVLQATICHLLGHKPRLLAYI